jgi:hypothetical protein
LALCHKIFTPLYGAPALPLSRTLEADAVVCRGDGL